MRIRHRRAAIQQNRKVSRPRRGIKTSLQEENRIVLQRVLAKVKA
ncbi:MAG: hypothetical protein SFY70_09760 [Bacteroidia bacterium]|nr:hypothetical protein [Bacteroidia bacterium]